MNNCKAFINNLVVTLPHSFPSPLIWLILSSLIVAFIFLFIQIYKTKKYLKSILNEKAVLPRNINKTALELGIANKIVGAKKGDFTSFCFGWFSPKICINLEFVRSLAKEELKAVLLHERHHLKSNDPLKILLTQTLQSFFFFLPLSKDFQNHYLLSQEIAADQIAAKTVGVFELRNALIKAISLPQQNFAFAHFFAEEGLEQRVNVLTYKASSVRFKISTLRLIASVFVILFFLVFIHLPIYAVDKGEDHSYYLCTSQTRDFSPATFSPVK